MKRLLAALLILVSINSLAQKPALDHSVYDSWKNLSAMTIPDAGPWAFYRITPQEGDGELHFYNTLTGKEYVIERGSGAKISQDGTVAVFKIAPFFQQTRQAKIDKKKSDEMPKDTLGIINLNTGEIKKYEELKAFKTGEIFNSTVAYQSSRKDNDTLYILNARTFAADTLLPADSYSFERSGETLYFTTKVAEKDSTTQKGLFSYNAASGTRALLTGERKSSFGSITICRDGGKVAVLAMLDTAKGAEKHKDIYLYQNGETKMLAAHDAPGIPEGWTISDNGSVSFHEGYITFGTAPVPPEKDTTLVDFEQAQLDIWVWNEDYIQPVQKVNLSREKNRTYLAKVSLEGGRVVQLADPVIQSLSIGEDNIQDYIIGSSDKPYRIAQQWDTDSHNDIYIISLRDGRRELILKDSRFTSMSSSPDGRYYAAYEEAEKAWYLYDITTGTFTNLTAGLGVNFWDEDEDTPSTPAPYSSAIWAEDGSFLLIRDRFDYWQFDPAGKAAPFLLTEGKGRANDVSFSYINPYNITDNKFSGNSRIVLSGKPVHFTTFNHTSKKYGYATKDISKKNAKLQMMGEGPYTLQEFAIASGKKQQTLFYMRENYEDGRDFWMTKDNFKTQQKLTEINPQIKEYNWGTVELVNWLTEDGIRAEGLLFKPENFDPTKKYPVMIYFYEKYSDELYAYRSPAPSASTVNIPYFVSNEYICFIPDIYYTTGHPGKSALRSIMPACDMLCEYPWIDGDNMAIQGQSWGGYQVAYMITQTNRFKAAGAGAPVSNMTSAYGGIRWASGIARTLQYEHGQSRIGDDLWHGFDLYVENSPLFFVPNVTTPVLIMHNDNDGAVPWWQGIEFFNGLRRCGKQAWLLQYNNEEHNLAERRNRKDLSIRLEQFFDHFLKGKPMPVWMSRGVPATVKGIDDGLGYDE